MSLYTEHIDVIEERWPIIFTQLQEVDNNVNTIELVKEHELSLVFNQIQIASSYDQFTEAHVQLQILPINITDVTLYGSGIGTIPNILIDNDNLVSINVVILNMALFKACLHYFSQSKWLVDSRVNLCLPRRNEKVSIHFVALPAELALATDESASIRDRIYLALDHPFIEAKKGIANKQLHQDIIHNIEFIKKDNDIASLFLSGKNKKYIVCGAGPTLAEHYALLTQKEIRTHFTLVAVDAAVTPLLNHGIMPDIIVSIDPVANKLFSALNMNDFKEIPLVYFPVVTSDLLLRWQGPRYTAYSTGRLYDSIHKNEPKGRLYCAGSVIHPAIDLVVKMGASEVVLLGADFSFPEGRTHTHWEEDTSVDAVHMTIEQSSHWVLNGFNERVPTLLNYRGYLRDLEDYITLAAHVVFYNGSNKGAAIQGVKIWPKLL